MTWRGGSPVGWPADRQLWVVAVLFFGVGDVVTTSLVLGVDGMVEVGPLTSLLVDRFGPRVMVPVKLAVLGTGYGCWLAIPRTYRVGVPLGLALMGVGVTAWNLGVLVSVT